MTKEDLELKRLEIKLEEIKLKKEKFRHSYIMEQLEIKKEIALIYRSKKQLKKIKKKEKELENEIW